MTNSTDCYEKLAKAIDEFRDAFRSEVDKVLMLLREADKADNDRESL